MSLLVLLGGARSGKSSLAVEAARRWIGPVSVVATAEARDDEMAERIRLHRAERPRDWETIEEPVELAAALRGIGDDAAVVIDCLSLWVANSLERGDTDARIEAEARSALDIARERDAPTIAVSNEVGLGLVPGNPLGRRYRDLLGRVNTLWANDADEAAFVVAGRVLRLAPAGTSLGHADGDARAHRAG